MKKILHLTQTDIESDSRILKEMECLANLGYIVSGLGVTLNEGAQRSAFPVKADIRAIKLFSHKLTFLPKTFRHALSLFEMMVKMLPRAILQRPDAVHCHDTLALPLGFIVKLLTGAKLIYDAHELESDRNGLTPFQGRMTLFVEKLLWRFVDHLIVVSPSIQQWYQEKIAPKSSAVILNSPLFSNEEDKDSDYLREKFLIPADRKVFLYIGILGHGRGLDLIKHAFTHSEITSHVVFLGYGELTDELKKLAAAYSNIHVHEAVPHSQVVPIARSADFGLCLVQNVSLSDYYCLPNKLFEYCFAGVPVLASNFPDIRAVLTEYGIGESCDLDPDDITRAIHDLESSDREFSFADLTPLTWQAQEQKIKNLYQKILLS